MDKNLKAKGYVQIDMYNALKWSLLILHHPILPGHTAFRRVEKEKFGHCH